MVSPRVERMNKEATAVTALYTAASCLSGSERSHQRVHVITSVNRNP